MRAAIGNKSAARLFWLLLAVLVVSSLLLVRSSYEARRLYAELDRAQAEQRRLDAEFKRLDAVYEEQGTHLRVERVAREKLKMRAPLPGTTDAVVDPGAAPDDAQALARAGRAPEPAAVAGAEPEVAR